MAKNVKKKMWQILMERHSEMVKESSMLLYDRVKILLQVVDDEEFRVDMTAKGESPQKWLEAKDYVFNFVNFTELRAMMKTFPRKIQWARGDIQSMRMETLKKFQARPIKSGPATKEEKQTRNVLSRRKVSLAEYLELEQRHKELQIKHDAAIQRIQDLERTIQLIGTRPSAAVA